MRTIQIQNAFEYYNQKIEDPDLDSFINWAKEYNIFQESNSKVYDRVCDLIKERLDNEGLDHEIVRPD